MSTKSNIYKCTCCEFCVEILNDNTKCCETLECCGEKMELMGEKTADFKTEKHVPMLEGDENGIKITVGSTLHPMVDEHYIEWIEVINGDYVNRKYLKAGDAPVAEFYVPKTDDLEVRSYCNKHGLWRA